MSPIADIHIKDMVQIYAKVSMQQIKKVSSDKSIGTGSGKSSHLRGKPLISCKY